MAVQNLPARAPRRSEKADVAGSADHTTLRVSEGPQQLTITGVGEDRYGAVDRDPLHGVHLVAGLRDAGHRVHRPVADELETSLVVGVRGAGQLKPQRAAEARLLFHLAQRALLVRLAALELALGK